MLSYTPTQTETRILAAAEEIFLQKELVFNSFAEPLRLKQDILQTVRTMMEAYFDFLSSNERLPYFIVTELAQNND